MRPEPASTHPVSYRPSRSWLGRLGRSNALAWMLSIGLHAAAFAGLYVVAFRAEVEPRRVIIPEARLTGSTDPAPPPSKVHLPLTHDVTPVPVDPAPPPMEDAPISAVTLDDVPAFALPANPESSAVTATGTSSLMASAAPASSFFGQAGNAYRVVYVVDVSVSLWNSIEDIVREMRRSVGDLVPTQQFNIVLARPQRVEEFARGSLVRATRRHKQGAGSFLQAISWNWEAGQADPIEAMRRAFSAKPELIYFLSDGQYADIETQLEQTLKELNPEKSVKITVIAYTPTPRTERLLRRIAGEHGGNYRAVEPEDIASRGAE